MLAMLAFLAAVVLVNLPWFRSAAGPRALAEELAGKLEQLRGRARAGQTLTAMAWLPNGQGLARSCLLLEGRQRANLRQTFEWDRHYPNLSGFAGELQGLASLPTPSELLQGANFNLSTWAGAYAALPMIAFRADGQAVGLNLPLVDGSYRLVVGDGLQTSSPTLLNAVHKAVQVQVPGNGAPLVEALSLGTLDHAIAPGIPGTAPAPPAAQPLQITELVLTPTQNPDLLGPDQARLEPEAYLHLTVRAQGSDFEPLTCYWTATALSGGSPGACSSAESSQMLWNGTAYESTWEWQAPAESAVDQPFRLNCEVRNRRGDLATSLVNTVVNVRIIRHGSILFSSDRDGQTDLYRVNEDGSRLRRLTWDPDGEQRPKLSPDSSRVVFPKGDQLWLANADGTQARALTPPSMGQSFEPTWNALGTQIAYVQRLGGNDYITIINADPANLDVDQVLTTGAGQFGFVDWHPDNSRLLYDINNSGLTNLNEYILASGTSHSLRSAPTNNENHGHFSPDGSRIVYVHRVGGKKEIWTSTYTIPAPGAAALISAGTAEVSDTQWNSDAAFGPDGLRIVFGSRRPSETAADERLWQKTIGSPAPPKKLSIKNLHDWDPTWGR